MKRFFILTVLLGSLLSVEESSAQIQVGAQLTTLKNTKEDVAITGFGIHTRFFKGDHLALGVNFRLWPLKYQETMEGSKLVRAGNFMGDFAGMLEYYYGENKVRPYIGTDAGIYFMHTILEIDENGLAVFNGSDRQAFFGLAPKIGLGIDLSKFFGFFGQIQYNALFGTAREIQSDGFQSKPFDKFWSFDAGAYFILHAGK